MQDKDTIAFTKEQLFSIWAPENAKWSRWVKPVLFSLMDRISEPNYLESVSIETNSFESVSMDTAWLDKATTAYIFDLPGGQGAMIAPALKKIGLQPVPLYNALSSSVGSTLDWPIFSLVDVNSILAALWSATPELEKIESTKGACPAFLLDSNRSTGLNKVNSGFTSLDYFDNRSVSLPTDFPSAEYLLQNQITSVVVVQETSADIQNDLNVTLKRWQDGGISILLKTLDSAGEPKLIKIKNKIWFWSKWYQFIAFLRLEKFAGEKTFGRAVYRQTAG